MNLRFTPQGMQARRMSRSIKHVWFFVVPGADMLDISGPWEVFGHANDLLGRPAYELALIGPKAPAIKTRHGLVVSEVRPLPKIGRLPNVAVVAGGSPVTPLPNAEIELVAWLRRRHRRIPTLVSICTGAFLLGEAGALDGHRVTTHWRFLKQLKTRFPKAQVVDEGIFVREKRLWTSAGITAGIDLTLALVEEDHGHGLAMAVAKHLVLFLRRSGRQAQFSSTLRRQENAPSELRDISTFVLEHLDEPLSVDRIAEEVAMSPRTLTRWCRTHLAESPAELVRRLRVDEARRLLEETPLPLKDITTRTGLGDVSTMWRVFTQRLGITPGEYRERFSGRH
jgi:transcriptional regulator GlxA family with amidase domain